MEPLVPPEPSDVAQHRVLLATVRPIHGAREMRWFDPRGMVGAGIVLVSTRKLAGRRHRQPDYAFLDGGTVRIVLPETAWGAGVMHDTAVGRTVVLHEELPDGDLLHLQYVYDPASWNRGGRLRIEPIDAEEAAALAAIDAIEVRRFRHAYKAYRKRT